MAWLALAAAVVSAVGQLNQADRQASQMEANAAINEQNAQTYKAQAAEQERKQRQHLQAVLGQQRTAIGKSGVTMAGTPLLVAEDMTGTAELDALTIRYNGQMKANAEKYSASVNRWQASETKSAARLSAFVTVLGGAASYYGMSQASAANPMYAPSGAGSGLSVPSAQSVWDKYTGYDPSRA
jgi:ABC-type Zn uptake system ZnuABC Zn-binding protein ZnuA